MPNYKKIKRMSGSNPATRKTIDINDMIKTSKSRVEKTAKRKERKKLEKRAREN